MTATGHHMRFAVSDPGIRLSRMRVPWTRGATSGALLLVLGAWAAIVPFIGPYLDFAYTPATNTAWTWTAGRGWLEVAPGAAVFAGGLLLLGSTNRVVAIAGSWLGVAGGAWLIIGPSLTGVLKLTIGTPDPTSSTNVQALEALFFFYAVGALILFLAAAALGRLSVQSVRDVAIAEQRAAQAETAAAAVAPAAEGPQGSPPHLRRRRRHLQPANHRHRRRRRVSRRTPRPRPGTSSRSAPRARVGAAACRRAPAPAARPTVGSNRPMKLARSWRRRRGWRAISAVGGVHAA
jgi:hypothetical protein